MASLASSISSRSTLKDTITGEYRNKNQLWSGDIGGCMIFAWVHREFYKQ